ncbi:MAG: PHB depolymerase family esterase [Clostridiales bacterium]|nr:PHB depolymerase family esterase [Clostridiales bacterium]
MKGKSFRQRLISSILSCAMVLTMATPAYAAEPAVPGAVQEETATAAVTMNDVESIQAFTDETIYGTGVVEVEVTYKEGVNLAGITADSYILEDRGSLNPDFGQIAIEDAVAEGQTVTLEISAKSQATENNKMVYTGDNKEGSRERNAFGIYCTGSWYRDENGVIHYGKDDNDAYENNTTGLGYQARECLELKLRHAGEAEEAAACLADEKGQYNEGGLWKETVDRQFGEGGFQSFADLGIQIESTAKDATDGTADEFVRGYAYIPEDYEPSNGIVFTLQGFGISFWTLNGANNDGTGIMYDSATTSWKDSGAIVVNIHDRSGMGKGGDNYDFVVDDVNVMKYFIDTYEVTGEVVLQGNSRGTNASSVIIKALAGRPYNPAEQSMDYDSPKDHQLDKEVYDFEIDTFICQNGTFGGKSWSDEDWEAIGETMMRVWVFDGEQDTNNIENIAKYKEVMSDLKGWWLRQNVRLTGYTSNLYYPWGESDHSTTRINGWYFDDAAYYGPDLTLDENGEIVYNTKLRDGDTYQLECRGSAATNSKNGYSYMVYDDLYQEWAFDDACPEVTDLMVEDIESIQATTDETIYGVGVVKVDITYKEGVDLRKVSAKDYVLEDRGTLTPDFGQVAISDVTVNGQVVTLNIAWDTGATASNKFLYTGPNKEGSRQRNAFGVYCTGAWYRDVDGVIHYGKDDNDEYENNTTGQGYQARECLELRLYHDGEDEEAAACLADDLGHYNADGLWKETIDNNFGEGGFITFEEAGIEIPSTSAATEGTGDPFVKGYFYIPESYTGEEAVPMVVTIQGHGISYWKLPDGTNNFGCGIMYDSSSIAWMDDGAIVVNIADRSSIGNGGADYDYVMDDVSVMKYFLDNYNIDPERIVLHGNSRSTMAASTIIQALAGQPYTTNQDAPIWGSSPRDHQLDKTVFDFEIGTFVCNNGLLGGQGLWTDADRKAIAKTGLRAWCFDSEQDFNNIDFRAALVEEYKAIGYSDEWIEENLRISCYPSELFYYWGESDHSVTRMNYWYFDDELYYGPDLQVVDGEIVYNTKLNPGDKYTTLNRGQSRDGDKEGYEYTLYGDLFQDWALERGAEAGEEAVDMDSITSLSVDLTQAAQLPLTGYFTKAIGEDRSVKVYISDNASTRSYFTVVAVPDGVDTREFLEESGWIDLADERGECLFVLEPGKDGWGTQAEEADYVNSAIAFLRSTRNANNVALFSTFGEFYFVGYGNGAAPLEAWAAANPLFVIAQAYLNDEGLTAEYFDTVKDKVHNGSTSGYLNISEALTAEIGEENLITNKDIPIPTLLAGYGAESQAYWMNANDCVAEAEDSDMGKVYVQAEDSDAWATRANGPISQVIVEDSVEKVAAVTNALAAFLYQYSRYDNSTAYGDSLALRMDYADARVNAQTAAKDGTVKESFDGVDVIGQASTQIENHGTLTVGVISFADVNGDGVNDPREYYMYVPAGFEGKKLPVIYVWAGGSQTNNIFFDATNWAKVADENGVILMFPGEGQSTNPVGVGYWGTKEFYDALQVILAQQVDGKIADVDFSRVYSTGQSAGSGTTTGFMVNNPEMFAAVASTSGIPSEADLEKGTFEMVPTYTIFGQGDIDHGTLWDDVDNKIDAWVPYVLKANGLGTVGPEEETEKTQDGRFITWYWRNSQGIALMQQGQTKYRAHNCYPMEMAMMWDYLEHFSYEVAEDGTITRYYSASAFAEDDAVVIVKDAVYETAVDFNTLEAPTHDYTESNQMPLTGYFKTALSGEYANREVYFYIPDTAMIRPYYHFITVPNNVNVDEWIVTSGWKQVSDETGECLYIMTPDAATGVWGSLEDEVGYITAAKAKHGGVGAYFSTFGEFYLEGYGAGAAPLEAWAAENPQFVISQAYIGGESAGSDVLTAAGETSYSWKHMTDGDIRGGRVDADGNQKILGQIVPRFADIINSDKTGYEGLLTKGDMAVPTWLINEDAEDSLSYWQDVNKTGEANQTVTAFAGAEAAGQVYPQAGDTWTTEYAGQISKVTAISTAADTEAYEFTRALRDDLTDYTRYDNTISYGNALTYRMDITAIEVERYTSEEKEASGKTEAIDQNGNVVEGEVTIKALTTSDGYITDMLLYVPETAGDEEIPVVVVWHGGSQTGHLFMDASAWWQVAATKGFAIVLPTRTNHNQRTTSDYDLTIFDALEDYLRKDGRFDMGRVYSSGQSMGGLATTEMAEFRTDKIAAGVATGAGTPTADNGGDPIPFGYMSGEANYTLRGIPGYMANTNYPEDETTDLVRSTEAAAAGADIYWDAVEDAEGNLTQFAKWISYFYDANRLDENDLSPYIEYSGGNALNGGTNNAQGTLADWNTNNARYRMWTWYNEDGIPVLKYGMVLAAAHNNLVGYADYIWDYVKNYRVDPDADGVVVRTYSASGFELDDEQEITFGHEEPVEKQDQKIDTAVSKNILIAYGSKSFNLEAETSGDGRLTYKSGNQNVAKVSKTGEVSIVGTGKAVITITAHSTDTCNLAVKKIVIRVVPAKAELKKVEKAGKGALKVTVKKDSKASGYMIQISADKNFKKSVTVVLDKNSQTSVTIKNLISGKKYYVRACAYKSIGGNKYGGAYSAVKSVKVK